MTKTRAWPVRVMYMLIAAALVISLIIVAAPAQKVAADPGLSEWDRVPTPAMMDDWVLAPNFMITGFDAGAGASYVIGLGYEDNDLTEGLKYQLLKSTDGAATWKSITSGLVDEVVEQDLGDDIDDITLVSVACDRADPSFLAVALVVTMGTPSTADDELHVFISNDGGTTFRDTGEVHSTLTAGTVLKFVVSAELDGMRNIAIGGTNSAGDTALLFRCLAIGDVGTGWESAKYDGWDDDGDFTSKAVVYISFAPSWATDNTVLVLTVPSTGDNVHLQSGTWGTIEAWNEEAGFAEAVAILTVTAVVPVYPGVAGINTPLDYSGQDAGQRYVWVNVNYFDGSSTEVGEIFRVKNKSVVSVDQQIEGMPWLTNVSYFGYISEGKAIASLSGNGTGAPTVCCTGVDVYRNDSITDMNICCLPWDAACKPPTGRGPAVVVFYAGPDMAYAVTLLGGECQESAWSVSFDDGDTWNQLSLVNTWIDYLSDVAVSPDCNKTMLVSVNLECGCACDSVWLHADTLPEAELYSGQWLRTWCGNLTGVNSGDYPYYAERGLLRLAPEETTGDTVYLVDRMSSTIYWNELETLACWKKRSSTSIISSIVDLAVKDESTIYALSAGGAVAVSDDHGAAPSWEEAVDSEVTKGWTIAVHGDDVLVGGQNGDVSHSADGGETFTELEDVDTSGLVTVAFDSYFDTNDTVYAAIFKTGLTGGGVYRWVIGESTAWRDLKAEPNTYDATGSGLTTDSNTLAFTGLVLDNADGNPMSGADTGGVLYASYVTIIDSTYYTGVARNLRPAAELCCEEADWDYLITSKYADFYDALFFMMPKALKICGCLTPDSNSKLFAIGDDIDYWYDMSEAEYGTVWTFEDCYAKAAPELTSPADGATIDADPCTCINLEVILRWDRQCDACSYDIQVALDEDFTEVVYDIEDTTVPKAKDPSYVIDRGGLNCDNVYYWRIRSADAETGQIIHSWWSDPRIFTVAPGPGTGVILTAPDNGVTNVPIKNIAFTWEIIASADNFKWVLSENADLSAPVESKTGLTTTAYTCTVTLDYDTTYYWQVTAYKNGAEISESSISTFTTRPEEGEPYVPSEPTTPAWVWVVIAIGAVLVIVVIVLIFRTRRV